MITGARRARIHVEQQKKKKASKKSARAEIPQKKVKGLRLPAWLRRWLGAKDDSDADMPTIGGEERAAMSAMCLGYFEKMSFLELFREMCGPRRSAVSYRCFCAYFRLRPDKWIRRLFDLVNAQVTGAFSFLEFLQFCGRFLLIDRDTTEEFCFRFLSRRGVNFMPRHSILDLDDFVTFVALRYRNITRLPKQRKLALAIFSSIDTDGDGGVSFEEFQDYCRVNPVFLRLSHPLQNHLRKCVFGMEFWVEHSRAMKTRAASALDVLASIGGRINRESEVYTLKHIEDPVIDNRGYALKTAQKPPRNEEESDESDDESVDHNREPPDDDDLLSAKDEQQPKIESTMSSKTNNDREWRRKITFFEPFSVDENTKPAIFRQDFVEISNARIAKKKKKHEEELSRRNRIAELKRDTYAQLVIACSDLFFGHRPVRLAFNHWLKKVNMQSKAAVHPPNYTGLRRIESKYRVRDTKHSEKDLRKAPKLQGVDESSEDDEEDEDVIGYDPDSAALHEGIHEQIRRIDFEEREMNQSKATETFANNFMEEKFIKKSTESLVQLRRWASTAQEEAARWKEVDRMERTNESSLSVSVPDIS